MVASDSGIQVQTNSSVTKGGRSLRNNQPRFRVRESTAVDPAWEVDKAIDLWERMLASRLRTLSEKPRQKSSEGASE